MSRGLAEDAPGRRVLARPAGPSVAETGRTSWARCPGRCIPASPPAGVSLAPRSGREERWFEAAVTAVVQDGAVVQLLGVCREVTDICGSSARSDPGPPAGSTGAARRAGVDRNRPAEILRRGGRHRRRDSRRRAGGDPRVDPRRRRLLMRAGAGWQRDVVGSANVSTGRDSLAGYTLASGRPVIVEELASETRFSGPPLLPTMASSAGSPRRSRGATAAPMACSGRTQPGGASSTTTMFRFSARSPTWWRAIQRRQLDQRHELMIRELRHRSGNLFSQLLALFSQTAKNSRSVADLVAKYEARVLALANAHRLITEGGWKSTSLNELLNTLLAPFLDRISFSGPERFSRARSDLRVEHGGARARHQCRQAWQPFRPRRAGGLDAGRSRGRNRA